MASVVGSTVSEDFVVTANSRYVRRRHVHPKSLLAMVFLHQPASCLPCNRYGRMALATEEGSRGYSQETVADRLCRVAADCRLIHTLTREPPMPIYHPPHTDPGR